MWTGGCAGIVFSCRHHRRYEIKKQMKILVEDVWKMGPFPPFFFFSLYIYLFLFFPGNRNLQAVYFSCLTWSFFKKLILSPLKEWRRDFLPIILIESELLGFFLRMSIWGWIVNLKNYILWISFFLFCLGSENVATLADFFSPF